MASKQVNELPQLTNPNFSSGDFFLVWDESSGQSTKFSVAQYRNDVLSFGLTGGNYNGTLDASLVSSIVLPTPAKGDWFFIDVAGTIEGLAVDVHDVVKYNGTSWERVPRGIAVAANSRQTLLSTQVAIAADGELPIADPAGAPGWYYKNTTGNKINWYFYGDTNYTSNAYADLSGMYAIITKTAGHVFFHAYTMPTGSGDAETWYKSKITWDDGAMQAAPAGRYVVHTAGMDVSAVEPQTPRIVIPVSASSVGTQGTAEEINLMAMGTTSGVAEGYNEFTVEQFAYRFGEQTHVMDLVSVKADAAEADPLFNASFKGNFANEAALPAATAGQWAINDDTDTIFIFDGSTSAWSESAGTPPQPVADVPYVYTYGDDNGTQTGYGWMNADNTVWDALPNGNLQANGGSFRPVDAPVKFATLKSPGDSVTLQDIDVLSFGTYYYRHAFFYAQGGYDVPWTTHNYNDIGSGYSYYVEGDADEDQVFGHNCYVSAYYGASSYTSGMNSMVAATHYTAADRTSVDLTWRIVDMGSGDYRLEFLVDGTLVSRSKRALVNGFATNGLDLYILAKKHQVFPQPSGAAVNDPNPPAGDTWPGPHTAGADFDSVNNRIRIPGAHVNIESFHPDDNSSFSVSAQLQFDGSISKRYPLYTTAEMSFDIGSANYYGYMQTFSHDAVWNTSSDVWYDTYDKAYNGAVNSLTYTWTGKASGSLPRHATFTTGASQHWMRSEWKGFYDETTKIFTADENGAYVWQYARYPTNAWSLGMNAAGNWTRFLSKEASFTSGATHNYNQTIINQAPTSTALLGGEKFPHGMLEPKSGWQASMNGELLASKTLHGNNPVTWLADGADAFIGMRSYDSTFTNVSYGGGTSMNEWTLTSDLAASEILSLHTAMDNGVDLRTWRDAEDGVTMHIYYPMADVTGDGEVKDYSGNGYDGIAEGID